jgi:hypothetical protein
LVFKAQGITFLLKLLYLLLEHQSPIVAFGAKSLLRPAVTGAFLGQRIK